MNDVYKALNYYKFRKSIITLFLLGLVIPTIHLLTTQNTTYLNVKYIFLPILFSFVAILVITVSRKLLLGKLLAYDLDFKTIVSDYYSFINTYIAGNYQDSVDTLKNLLSKKDYKKLNHKKIVIFYFLLMVYEKLNDTENMLICTNEIICSDPNNYTFFRHTVESD